MFLIPLLLMIQKKYKGLCSSEATSGVENDIPDHEGMDEHGDLT